MLTSKPKISLLIPIKQITQNEKPIKKNTNYGTCSTCGRRDNDGGPLCGNVFCPGGN